MVLIMIEARCHERFAEQVDPGSLGKAEAGVVFEKQMGTDLVSQRHKHRVAGILNSLNKGFTAMSAHFVTPDSSVFYHAVSRTGKGILRCHDSLFQAGCRRNDLKCGSRLIRIIDTSISPHCI